MVSRWRAGLRALAAVAVCSATLLACGGGGSSNAASVLLQPRGLVGSDPFTASVASGPAVDFPDNVQARSTSLRNTLPADQQTRTLVATGTTPGLYGGSGDTHVCDPEQLVRFLGQHQDKATAWARVFGIASKDIAGYVAKLTPVVLMSDTLVTNHGYRNGVATVIRSVLQAGTAVLVDQTGTPRVKCNCGNPLTPPQPIALAKAKTRGTAWFGYTPAAVTVVRPGGTTDVLFLINITTGAQYSEPTGGAPGGATSVASTETAICNATFPDGVSDGNRCGVSNLKVSTVDPSWVFAVVGLYNLQDQPASDLARVIWNLTTHHLIGPTNVGFCSTGNGLSTSIVGYSEIPANVLADFGLSPCPSPTTTTTPPKASTTTVIAAPAFASFAGTWRAHVERLVIDNTGTGHLDYPDLALCSNCSNANAPMGTLVFALTSLTNGVALGSVTASSDPQNSRIGDPVKVQLTAGSPGQLLEVEIGGKQLINFCNSTSVGQCGA